MNALAFSGTNFLFSQPTDHDKKESKRHNLVRLDFISKMLQAENEAKASYLLKPGKSQNYLKPAKTIQLQPKRSELAETTQENNQKFQIWGNLEFSTSFRSSQILVFWLKKYQPSNHLTRFSLHPFLRY